MNGYITVKEAATIAGVTAPFIRRLANGGRITFKKISIVMLISESSLKQYMREATAFKNRANKPTK